MENPNGTNTSDSIGFAPNAPTDGRDTGNWKTRYEDQKAQKGILFESLYLVFLFFLVLVLMFLVSIDCFDRLCFNSYHKRYSYAFLGGTFGGVAFAIKWLYHSVAKFIWNEDRRLWRILTPLVSGGLSLVMVLLVSSNMINLFSSDSLNRPSAIIGFSFLVGYFSDSAIGKLTEVANTFFGSTNYSKNKK